MCGFVGCWNRDDGIVCQETIERMMSVMRYRGPDDCGIFIDQNIGLGHLRLSILDLSAAGRQPLLSRDGKGILVYNGELYNYQQLRTILTEQGVEFRSKTDTEVFLYALTTWGVEHAVRVFKGMFSFAYFDRSEKTLWLGRDKLGIKPLHVAMLPQNIIFASEIKALLHHPDVTCQADMVSLITHLTCEYLDGIRTPFKGIDALKPGVLLKIASNKIAELPYFDIVDAIDIDRICTSIKQPSEQLFIQTKALLTNSVKTHMASDVPLATLCSGGLDSSLVTAYAKKNNNDVVGYVARVENAKPEYLNAQIVGRHLHVEIREVAYSEEQYLRDWPVSIWHSDLPPVYASDQAFMGVAHACKRDGIKVVLTGEGADELFGGYPWQNAAWKLWRDQRTAKLIYRYCPPLGWLFQKINQWVQHDFATLCDRTFARYPAPFPYNEYQILRRACIEEGAEVYTRYHRLFDKLRNIGSDEDRALLSVCLNDMYGHLRSLLHRNDRMGMAASIESRVPFLDNDVLDFAMHLPAKAKNRNGCSKWLLKKVASDVLPQNIVYGKKIGFHVSRKAYQYGLPLINGGVLAEMFRWSAQTTQKILFDLRTRPHVLFSIVGAEIWARIYLRNESCEQIGENLVRFSKKN